MQKTEDESAKEAVERGPGCAPAKRRRWVSAGPMIAWHS